MRTFHKTILGSAALGCALLPGSAKAERVYFLVGIRHIYRIGDNRDANLPQREEIEKAYADRVSGDQDTFQKDVDGGADKEKESVLLNNDLNESATERDNKLGAIFENADGVREEHPELRIDGDGPYQVMGVDYHTEGAVQVFDTFEVFAPWPGYVVVGNVYYGGWVYGRPYRRDAFFARYHEWHDRNYHGERFAGGFYGHRGPVHFEPRGFHDGGWHAPVRHEDHPKYGGNAVKEGPKKYGGGEPAKAAVAEGHAPSPSTPKYGSGAASSSTSKYGGGSPAPHATQGETHGQTTTAPKYGSGASSTKAGTIYKPSATSHTLIGGKTQYKMATPSTYHGTKVQVGSTATKTTTTGSGGGSSHTGTSTAKSTAVSHPQKSTPASHSSGGKKKG